MSAVQELHFDMKPMKKAASSHHHQSIVDPTTGHGSPQNTVFISGILHVSTCRCQHFFFFYRYRARFCRQMDLNLLIKNQPLSH